MCDQRAPRAVILDIEGTTTPIAFVQDVLFPYAHARIAAVLQAHHTQPGVAALIREAADHLGKPTLDIQEAIAAFLEWSTADRKIRPLKELQGMIWKQGYHDGSLRSPIYPDVVPALREWQARGLHIYVYSSGSVEAQRLLFEYSGEGDLTGYFHGYFDTAIGPKIEPASYRRIQSILQERADQLLFLSDNAVEIATAHSAGWQAILVARESATAQVPAGAIASFLELRFQV